MALAQEGIPSLKRAASPRGGRFILFDSQTSRRPETTEGQSVIDVSSLRAGRPQDPFKQLLDEGSASHGWSIGPVLACEEIACVDKRALRRSVLAGLRSLLEAQNGIWLQVSRFPFPFRAAFNFRFDHDEYCPADLTSVLRAIKGYEAAVSHYVCGSTHEAFPEALAALRGMDVGSHGYWHHTYTRADDNLRNLQRGIEVLERAGIQPAGFVAPHGRFNPGLLQAMEQLALTHSSEFGLAYDDLPFWLPNSMVLQIPVYPVCLGICLEAWHASPQRGCEPMPVVDALVEHWLQAARARHDAGEPMFFYGHPDGRLGRYPQVLSRLLSAMGQMDGVWRIDRTRFAAWWRARAAVQLSVEQKGEAYVVCADRLPARHHVAIEYWQGDQVAQLPLLRSQTTFTTGSLEFNRRAASPSAQALRVGRSRGLRAALKSWLDWEKVTPIEGINTGTLRGMLKQRLRRVRTP